MAKNYEILEYMHNSIYPKMSKDKFYNKRKANIYFSEPEAGINEDTGILLFIAGYGGNANSNVYKKMREQFADKYNLVTVQCDYFGYEFMQGSKNIDTSELNKETLSKLFSKEEIKEIYNENKLDFNKLIEIGSKYNIVLNLKENLSEESLENFNDMGIMQSLDNIAAILKVMSIIYENGYEFNTKKVILYGQSQGAYLSYLCNRFCPTLFSSIIDNSSWLYPEYLLSNRYLTYLSGNLTINVEFEYLAKKINSGNKILDLNYLYSSFENNCEIIAYHGITDNLITHFKKKDFCRKIKKCSYSEITKDKVDGEIFKSTNHGLDADFLKLFDYTIKKLKFEKDTFLDLPQEVIIKTGEKDYYIDYKDVLPLFTIV
jgi:predicted esterase